MTNLKNGDLKIHFIVHIKGEKRGGVIILIPNATKFETLKELKHKEGRLFW